jgi:hypothetical protein
MNAMEWNEELQSTRNKFSLQMKKELSQLSKTYNTKYINSCVEGLDESHHLQLD